MTLTSEEQLRELYGHPGERAQKKVLNALDPHAIHFLSKAPFGVLTTVDAEGRMDVSPKGGAPGFAKVKDGQVLVPDAKGNNRLDGLVNILATGRVGSLWFIPGVDETLRINGRATITTDPEVLALFAEERNAPKCAVVIDVEESFLHCAKALMRSGLWKGTYAIDRADFPSMGQMLNDQLGTPGPVESQEDMVKRYQPDL